MLPNAFDNIYIALARFDGNEQGRFGNGEFCEKRLLRESKPMPLVEGYLSSIGSCDGIDPNIEDSTSIR
jgi:hypothetical protein